MAFDTDSNAPELADRGDFTGGSNNDKNSGDKSAQADNGIEGSNSLGGAFGLFGATTPEQDRAIATGGKAPEITGLGFIDSKLNQLSVDPLGFLIDTALGLIPGAGWGIIAANQLAKATSTDPSGITSLGSGISAGIRGAMRGDIIGDTTPEIQAADNSRNRGSESDQLLAPDSLFDQPAAVVKTQPVVVQPPPTKTGTVVTQPVVPLAQPGQRVSNPFAPVDPTKLGIGSIWL